MGLFIFLRKVLNKSLLGLLDRSILDLNLLKALRQMLIVLLL